MTKKKTKKFVPLKERQNERLDLSKLKLPIVRKLNPKSETLRTIYRGKNGRIVSRATYDQSFKTKDGYQLDEEQVDILINTTMLVADPVDIYTLFDKQLSETKLYDNISDKEMLIDYEMLDIYMQDKLKTKKGLIKDKAKQMGYLHTLKNDAISEIEGLFKNYEKLDIINVEFDMTLGKDYLKVGDYVFVKIYTGEPFENKKAKVKNNSQYVGVLRYEIKSGKLTEVDMNKYF